MLKGHLSLYRGPVIPVSSFAEMVAGLYSRRHKPAGHSYVDNPDKMTGESFCSCDRSCGGVMQPGGQPQSLSYSIFPYFKSRASS